MITDHLSKIITLSELSIHYGQSSVVKYKYRDNGQKYYDVNQAIRDGGFPDPDDKKAWKGLKVRTRLGKVECIVDNISGNLEERYWVKYNKNRGFHLDVFIDYFEQSS
jgi:hypothetical protein